MNKTEETPTTAATTSQKPEKSQGPLKYTKYGMAFGLVIVIVGVCTTLLIGYRPAPTQVMKPSFFDTADQIGVVTLKRFYAPLVDEKIVVLGVPTNRDWAPQIVTGFLIAAQQNSRAFTRVIVEDKLSNVLKDEIKKVNSAVTELNTNTETLAELVDALNTATTAGERVLLVMPNIYTTHLSPGNTMSRLESMMISPEYKEQGRIKSLFTISVGPLALEAGQEKELDPVCMGSERDGSGTADFGCAIAQAGRFYYRKRVLDKEPNARERFVALMQAPRPNDYLLLVREPESYGKKQ